MFDLNFTGDWGHYGVGSFYDEREKALRDAIKSGEDFDSGWHGFKKDTASMCVYRKDGRITVGVSKFMDSALEEVDLFGDFLTDEEMEMLTDERVEEIRNRLFASNYTEEPSETGTLPADSDFSAVMKMVESLDETCEKALQDSYRLCIATTLRTLYSDPSPEFIAERTGAAASRANEILSGDIRTDEEYGSAISMIKEAYAAVGYAEQYSSVSRQAYGDDIIEMEKNGKIVEIRSHRGYTSLLNVTPDVRSIIVTEAGTIVAMQSFYVVRSDGGAAYYRTAEECEKAADGRR